MFCHSILLFIDQLLIGVNILVSQFSFDFFRYLLSFGYAVQKTISLRPRQRGIIQTGLPKTFQSNRGYTFINERTGRRVVNHGGPIKDILGLFTFTHANLGSLNFKHFVNAY